MNGQPSGRAARRETQDLQRALKAHAAMSAAATRLVLLRHGETDWNAEHRLQGQSPQDPPMNATGLQQAAVVAATLAEEPLSAVYCSDTSRTRAMAQMIAAKHGLQVQERVGLRERSLGILEGLTRAEAVAAHPAAYRALGNNMMDSEIEGGGESVNQLRQRVQAALQEVVAAQPGGCVAVVVHGGVLHAIYQHATGHAYSDKIFNGSISRLVVEGETWALLLWNQTSHLRNLGVQFAQDGFGGTGVSA